MAVTIEEKFVPKFSGNQKGMSAEWQHKIAWADVQDYMEELMGSATVIGDDRKKFSDTRFPGKDWLLLEGFTVEPFHERVDAVDADGVPTCSAGAMVTLSYSTKEYDSKKNQDSRDDPDRPKGKDGVYQTHRIRGITRMITHSQFAVRWETAATGGNIQVAPDMRPAFPEVIVEHELTWHEVPDPPLTTLYTFLGKVNDDTFYGHAAETVLFSGVSATRQSNMDGSRKWELVMNLDARLIQSGGADDGSGAITPGWNHFLQPKPVAGKEWVRIMHADGTTNILPTADFDKLLKF